jgi:hypothetical protein
VRAVANSLMNMERKKPGSCEGLVKSLLKQLARFISLFASPYSHLGPMSCHLNWFVLLYIEIHVEDKFSAVQRSLH